MPKKFLTTDEICEFYGIDAGVVNELVAAGELKALPDRGTMKYRSEDVAALIRSGKLLPTKELPELGEDALEGDADFSLSMPGNDKVDFLEIDESALATGSGVGGGTAPPPAAVSSDEVVVLQPGDVFNFDAEPDRQSQTTPPPEAVSSDEVVVLQTGEVFNFTGDRELPKQAVSPPVDRDAPTVAEVDINLGGDHVLAEVDDEGLTLPSGDSGITLEVGDSGITLADDSGLTLEGDSGITLGSGRKTDHNAVTEELDTTIDQPFRFADEEEEPAPVLAKTVADDETPGLFDEASDPTAVLDEESEGRDQDVSDELEDVVFTDDETVAASEDEVQASDEVFTEEEDFEEGEGLLKEAPGKPKVVGPTWGLLVNLSVIAASVVIAINAWLIFEGMVTMWSGADPSGPAQSLIQSLAGLM